MKRHVPVVSLAFSVAALLGSITGMAWAGSPATPSAVTSQGAQTGLSANTTSDTTSVPGVSVPDRPETITVTSNPHASKPEAVLHGKWKLHFTAAPELIFQAGENKVEIYGLRPDDGFLRASIVVHLSHELVGCYKGRVRVVFSNGEKFSSKVAPNCTEKQLIASRFGEYEQVGKTIEEALPIAIEQGKNVIRLKAHGVAGDIERFRVGIRPPAVEHVSPTTPEE